MQVLAWSVDFFVSSYRELRALAGVCQHDPGAHMDIRGKRDASGMYVSRLTVCVKTITTHNGEKVNGHRQSLHTLKHSKRPLKSGRKQAKKNLGKSHLAIGYCTMYPL